MIIYLMAKHRKYIRKKIKDANNRTRGALKPDTHKKTNKRKTINKPQKIKTQHKIQTFAFIQICIRVQIFF